MPRRIGNWYHTDDPLMTHPARPAGWRLDGTDLTLDYDRHDTSGTYRGAWLAYGEGYHGDRIDHYLEAAMEWCEEEHTERLMRAFG